MQNVKNNSQIRVATDYMGAVLKIMGPLALNYILPDLMCRGTKTKRDPDFRILYGWLDTLRNTPQETKHHAMIPNPKP